MSLRWKRIAVAGMLISAAMGCTRSSGDSPRVPRARQSPAATMATSRAELADTIADLRAQVTRDPRDIASAVRLADALLRQTRVSNNAGLAAEAARVLGEALTADPDRYEARRMLAAVDLSQHRFRDALQDAGRCLTIRTDDAFVYGITGDAYLEIGEYPRAFDAFDRMNALKPTAASYARASYARELSGDLPRAVALMQMAAEATTPQDAESLAWHYAQLGHLYLEQGKLAEARRQYAHADYVFPGHPFASDGLARVAAASGDYEGALTIVRERLKGVPMPADFALAGDLFAVLGRQDEAERHYRLAEAAWRSDVPEPSRLARFLAERGRRVDEAVRLAEATFAERRDIFTADALAWASFKAGQLDRARLAMVEAMRTGTHDRVILYHAAEIERASGHLDAARRLVAASIDGSPHFDLVAAPAAIALRSSLGAARVAAR